MRRTTTALLATCLALGVAGCSGSDGDGKAAAPAKTTVTATPTATPSLSQAEIKRQCSVAVAEAAPEWDDWNFNTGKWQDDPRTPDVCQGLADKENRPRGNREFMDALIDGLDMADDPRAEQ
ncbi:hypothetical protein ACFQ0X_43805 [Streptomyces rectiviolaceus]|uniref:Lipoprotein n=1 Tax=Streptomyces rectiviolaceus TaxID=332591 RepID=A0ABP6MKB5_9ACTN